MLEDGPIILLITLFDRSQYCIYGVLQITLGVSIMNTVYFGSPLESVQFIRCTSDHRPGRKKTRLEFVE